MITIHSSSIAHYPVAYPKPQTGHIDGNSTSANGGGNGNPVGQSSEVNARPSSTEQIQAALAEAEVSNTASNNQPNNTRTQKALNAYTQNYNQATQRRVAEIISGINLYA